MVKSLYRSISISFDIDWSEVTERDREWVPG